MGQEVQDGARALMKEAGQGPVSLIRDGVVSAQDLDVVMKDGMGMRYAFMGPMETIHLNAEGTQNYVDRYGHTIFDVSADLGPIPTGWKQETEKDKAEVKALEDTMIKDIPVEELYKRRVWRDKRLAALAKLKRDLDREEKQ